MNAPRSEPPAGDGDDALYRAVARRALEPGTRTTWINHWSLLHADWEYLARMDLIGVDGTLLQMALGRSGHGVGRSSADLVLPHVFDLLDEEARIALVGAEPGVADRVAQRLPRFDVMCVDGYSGLTALKQDPRRILDFSPRLVVVGLGAGLQERVGSMIHEWLPDASVCTAGGWLDQYARSERYFPRWVHRARLGWAWRIAHEPRRLIGRYTVEAVGFLASSGGLIRRLEGLGDFDGIGLRVRS
ncbi:WecB/TagA/CpsF family glycosyltransferase [Actinomyces sp. B33]|uniref:WecB/TagA/CpsF family glycosyltransferase n=1 Tax=Actinomyces sp. B33 TaxID=2942131 RepID=UPI002341C9C3|nr:WecB/TagA/CpsF family glycosyltransferase [Actinomyces sp. B33]MDC4233606.1 WecB/TagA/CpsF family glycosyltransferase [Actinomyces sp. B33]